ncbi:nicotinate-nucleotide adenylyltransferase [Candidatus Vallotia cooleyia]|uniref:nicotinate-nucleotide adenylyltransferase n=1 Tax=Candidatus Vallotiella adelgis TaxID=1177211 RepID=UPI001D01CDB7|nr:nicotinate-nucleotide adenylyltransferase [Candidatus Vallotia cooleyia]
MKTTFIMALMPPRRKNGIAIGGPVTGFIRSLAALRFSGYTKLSLNCNRRYQIALLKDANRRLPNLLAHTIGTDSSPILPTQIGILGGTFDPIHVGHLALAYQFSKCLKLTELVLLPAGRPWQKNDVSSAWHRLAMTRLAASSLVLPTTRVTVSTNEINTSSPSFMTETLATWRVHYGEEASLTLLIGADQLVSLHTWKNWRQLFEFAHVGVATRPGFDILQADATVFSELGRRSVSASTLHTTTHGYIFLDTTLSLDVSATHVRQLLRERTCNYLNGSAYVPHLVWQYIHQHHLYHK